MGSTSFSIEGLVVSREEPAEGHRDLSLFSAKRGLLRCRRRLSAGKLSPVPDLFSEIDAVLNPMSGGCLFFLGEWKVIRARPEIGADYRRLEAAGALARLVLRNARWLATFDRASLLMGKALDALEAEAPPEAARLKALYLLAFFEGYPVAEDWLMAFPKPDRDAIDGLLCIPIGSCEAASADLIRWRRNLEQWIVVSTDFVL